MKKISATLLVTSLVVTSACEIANDKRVVNPASILGFFEVESSALDSRYIYDADNEIRVRDLFSSVWGTVFVSDNTASFSNLSDVQLGCKSSNLDGPNMQAQRFVDVGDMTVVQNNNGWVVNKSSSSFNYFNLLFLPSGLYTNKISGVSGTLAFDQEFSVPTSPRQIEVTSGPLNVKQVLPSPLVDVNSVIHVVRSEGVKVDFDGPTDASYVRVVLSDLGQNNVSVTCFGLPNETLEIPAEELVNFSNSDNGSLSVDFVSISLKKDIPRIKESFIRSFTRHRHGIQIFPQQSGDILFNFGVVRFE